MGAARRGQRRGVTTSARPKRKWIPWVAGVAATALVVTLAVVVSGFDSRETPREDPSVWAMRSSGQYARVNTETAEIDTVRRVEGPSGLVQSGSFGLLLTQGDGRAWTIDPAAPQDIRDQPADDGSSDEAADDAAADEPSGGAGDNDAPADEPVDGADQTDPVDGTSGPQAIRTPAGTRDVIAAGNSVLFHTDSGEAHLGEIVNEAGTPSLGSITRLDPYADQNAEAESEEDRIEFRVDAAAIDANGLVALFSSAEHAIRWFDAATGEFRRGATEVSADVPADEIQLAIVDGNWVLLDAANGIVWREGMNPVEVELVGPSALQGSSTAGSGTPVLIADEAGLWAVSEQAERISEAGGVAARPEQVGDNMVAAWLSATSASLWTEESGEISLELDAAVDSSADPAPEIRTSGDRALLTDVRSGMMWTVPDGRLIPVEQWSLVDPPKQEAGAVVTQDVTEQEPPVAVDDSFGVRAGEPAPLPVLLNDHDPNRADVLTVVTEGLGEGLSDDFGAVEVLSDGQGLMIHPSATASGSASFSYRITDGVHVSQPATVTVTAVPDTVNSAPQWCPVDGCQRTWPAPELAPGGTLVLPIIEAWVDPEGDPIMVADAAPVNAADPVRTLVTANGRLAVRHTDPNAPEGDIAVNVRLVDAHGEATDRELRIRVRPGAAAEFAPAAATVEAGEPILLYPLERVTGGSGSFVLVDAAVQSGAAKVSTRQSAETLEVSAPEAGGSLISVTVRDTVTDLEISGVIRITAVEQRAHLAVPPLRAFVRPLGDTTIDVLDAIPGANSRSLVVQSATVIDGELRADVIEHSRIRLAGGTSDGQPGRIGSADVIVAEGELTARGRITVFQVPETVGTGAIAVADAVTVRAGSVVNIPVLDNDVAPPGERLVLHPEIGASGAEGELAFASGSQVRYLAPTTPGTYTLSYTTYGASSPEMSDVGQVRVTVQPTGSNRDPQPQDVTVRVGPGETVTAAIPVTRADPDGDRVRLVMVGTPDDAQISASIVPRSGTVQVAASNAATRGTRYVNYTVRDDFGGEADGRLRIIVSDPDPSGGAPIVYSDYVRIARGTVEPVVVRPLENDLDPAGGSLSITEVVPNVPGGESSPQYAALAERIDTSSLKQGIVRIAGGEELGAYSYRYTVRSGKSQSTADGLIVVQVSDRIGRQAPSVQDTVLSVRDRAELKDTGVDVVTGRVRWATGDVDQLKLSLWGDAAERYSVNGTRIVGTYRAEGDLVPFRLAGADAGGEEVETFGFLVVPPLDELRLTLKPGAGSLAVNENESVEADLTQMLDLGPGDRIELAAGSFSTQRSQASCVPVGETGIRYSAGKEAPWSDTCMVQVRLVEQNTYTSIPIAVDIRPDDPVVTLNPLTRTIAPGETETIDLTDMVSWQGGREGQVSQLRWQASGGSTPFVVGSSGSQVQVTADAGGVPGTQQAVSISVSGAGESQSVLTLRIGTAAQDTPRGGTVSLQCTVGSDCSAPLVGVGGEYDPFAGKQGGGLHLVSVDNAGCQFGTLRASGDSVTVAWPDNRGPGGRCTASFTVRDAQNRTGTGTIEFDAQGVPRAPSSISAVAFTESSVTLEVQLGEASNAHPSVTGVSIQRDGASTSARCEPSGSTYRCVVTGLNVGERHSFRAVAVNAVGESNPTSNAVETWAFRQPQLTAGDVTVSQSDRSGATTVSTGTLEFQVSSGDNTIRGYRVTVGAASGEISGRHGSVSISGVPVGGAVPYTVVPISRFEPPSGGSNEGAGVSGEFSVAGLPTIENLELIGSQDSRDIAVSFTVSGNGDDEANIEWRARGGSGGSWTSGVGSTGSATITAPSLHQMYTVTVRASNRFGDADQVSGEVWVGGNPPALTLGDYTVSKSPSSYGAGVIYGLQGTGPTVSGKVGTPTVIFTPGGSSLVLDPNTVQPVTAVQCVGPEGAYCSPTSNAAGWVNAPTTVTVEPNGVCYSADAPPADPKSLLTISAAAHGSATVTAGSPNPGQNRIPLTITWSGDFSLNQATVNVCWTPPTPVEPEPEPDPEPEP